MKLTKDDVWGHVNEDTLEVIDYGMCIARGLPDVDNEYFTQGEFDQITAKIPNICPVWHDELPYKSVTVICAQDQESEVIHLLNYVHGSDSVSHKRLLQDGTVAIRSNYMCW